VLSTKLYLADPAGALAASPVAAGVLHSAFGTAVDGATRLQSAVPVVRRIEKIAPKSMFFSLLARICFLPTCAIAS
jgi:hypothetical protein